MPATCQIQCQSLETERKDSLWPRAFHTFRREDNLGRIVTEIWTKQNKTLEHKQEGASNWEKSEDFTKWWTYETVCVNHTYR